MEEIVSLVENVKKLLQEVANPIVLQEIQSKLNFLMSLK